MGKRILFFGAGVIGSLYAARMAKTGQDVTVLARNRRLAELRENGLVLAGAGRRPESVNVRIIPELAPDDIYDYIFITLRLDHVGDVLPLLQSNRSASFVFMVNTPSGYGPWTDALGRERVIAAFPGAGGKIENGVLHYSLTPRLVQPTTLGEVDGARTSRTAELKRILTTAGFPTVISGRMDTWQKSHVALVTPLAYAIYADGGTSATTARNRRALRQMVRSLRENFTFLKKSGIGIAPFKLNLFRVIPDWLLIQALRQLYRTEWAETVISNHALAARYEMDLLAKGFVELAEREGFELVETRRLLQEAT